MKFTTSIAIIVAVGLLICADSAHAIVVGQIDNFEDETLQNWANGGAFGVPPVLNINTGGPAGKGDNFMQVTSDGSGPGQFLTVFNRAQWLGNYIALGVTAIELDLRNLGAVDLTIRLGFKEFASPGAPGYLSAPFSLPAGSGWQHTVFFINSGSMLAISGPAAFNSFFASNFGEMRIINEAGNANLTGDTVTAQLGVDNVHAVPEPSAILLTAVGLLAFAALRRKKRD
jgi:PEP-CTERM motif-containing protein